MVRSDQEELSDVETSVLLGVPDGPLAKDVVETVRCCRFSYRRLPSTSILICVERMFLNHINPGIPAIA